MIAHNEEAYIGLALASVKDLADEIIVVDSGSTDRTVAIAKDHGAKVFIEEWKGFGPQKNSALAKASGDWILYLDADEELSPELASSIKTLLKTSRSIPFDGYMMARRNIYLNRWIKHSGYYPDRKLRLIKRGAAEFELSPFHEELVMTGKKGGLPGDIIHYAYASFEEFIEHANRYSSLGAEMVTEKRRARFSLADIVLRPLVTFVYRYFFRLGFLDGREGLIVQMQYAAYVSWKYAKAWEISRKAPKHGP